MDQAGVGEIMMDVQSADRALYVWIQERLRPLANQPIPVRLTIQAGGGTLTVKREPNVEGAVKTR